MKRIEYLVIFCLLFFSLSVPFAAMGHSIDLSGNWKVRLGDKDEWHTIILPGTTDDAGLGEPDTLSLALSKPQLLHLTRKNRFVGEAVYTREIDVPKTMAGKPLRFKFERVMWKSCLEVDGKTLEECQESLTTPHFFLIPEGLTAGQHELALSIDNRKQYEISTNNLAHAYTDDTQIMWNGVLGEMSLETVPEIDIADLQVYPDVHKSGVLVKVLVENHSGKSSSTDLKWKISGFKSALPLEGKVKATLLAGKNEVEFNVTNPILGKSLWSEFNPEVLTLSLQAGKDKNGRDVDFGMREIKSENRTICINDNPVFLRGTLECCIFPLTGTPPTTEEGWRKVFETARNWGLNHLRFHSWCPPDAAFRVADRIGFYLQVECPLWSVDILPGNEGENGEMKKFVEEEFDRIVSTYGNHPSFCMMTVGNELQKDFRWLNYMTEHMHRKDPRHLYAATSFTFEKGHGGHAEANDDFIVTQWTDDGWVRGQGVFDKEPPSFEKNYSASTVNLTVPLVEHEIGQYAVFPDLREIDRYTGVLDPINLKSIRKDLEDKGCLHKAEEYLNASGKLAAILYKEEVERALKTSGTSGIQLLGLQDFPGQGTALIGLVNAFWDSKGIVDSTWFRQFCSPVVPLADFRKAVYTTGEVFTAKLSVANYSASNEGYIGCWKLTDGSEIIARGELSGDSLPYGVNGLVDISVPITAGPVGRKLELTVELPSYEARNSWSIWVYPSAMEPEYGEVIVTRNLPDALAALKEGRKVLFSPALDRVAGTKSKFVPVFWSPVHFPAEAGAMGIICDSTHPALSGFPNDGHTDWQWWYPVKNSVYMDISDTKGAAPIIGMVDNFTTNRELALMFESKVGNGSILFSSIDLLSDEKKDPATAQLFSSVLSYMNSNKFLPQGRMSEEEIAKFVKK